MAKFFLSIPAKSANYDGTFVSNVDYTGISPTIVWISWDSDENKGETFNTLSQLTTYTDPAPYQVYLDEVEAMADATKNPVTYYFTQETTYEGFTYEIGQPYVSVAVGHPAPPNTTLLVPTDPDDIPDSQTLQWDGSAWVLASFDITLGLSQAKTSLIQTVTQDGAAAVNFEVSLYSTVQQIEAPVVTDLDTVTYPGTTIGEYQDYVNGLVASATATINSATTVPELYPFNPADLPFIPAASGTIFTGRGGGVGPLDMNVSYFTAWNSTTVEESDTELFIPGTNTVIVNSEGQFDSIGNCFVTGDYRVQIRQASSGLVLAEYECPLSLAGEDVTF